MMQACEPSSRYRTGVVVAETLYWTFLGLHALTPMVWQPVVTVNGAVIPMAICGLISLAVVVPLLCLPAIRLRPLLPLGVLLAVGVMSAWGLVLVSWHGQYASRIDLTYRCLEPIGTIAAAIVGVVLGQATDRNRIPGLVQRATLFIAIIGVIYGLKSLFAAGLSFGVIRDDEQRARGPLYGPAVGHLALLPALAVALVFANTTAKRLYKLGWWCVGAGAIFALVAMGSRSALISLAICAAVLLVKRPDVLLRPIPILLILLCTAGLFLGTLVLADRSRLTTISDPYRETTYATAWRILSDDPALSLVGRGPGSVYQWLHIDMSVLGVQKGITAVGLRRVSTPWGESLNSPHSLPVLWTINQGILGFLTFCLLIVALVVAVLRSRTALSVGLSCALLATTTTLFFDVALGAIVFPFASLWWLFFTAAFSTDRPSSEVDIPCGSTT